MEELKALAMGYATHDPTLFPAGTPPKFGLARIGAGRVDPALAAAGQVIAMNADGSGMVAVTFEPEAPAGGPLTQTRKVRVVNHGTTSPDLRPGDLEYRRLTGRGILPAGRLEPHRRRRPVSRARRAR